MVSEFNLIERYFHGLTRSRGDVVLGIGDDAAVLRVPEDRQLVIAMDTLVAGRHFPEGTPAFDIGYKALAVNLSDLAAMGAVPAWATLSLTVPEADEDWLAEFSAGFGRQADEYGVDLVGGDTTRGPLSVTVQLHGFVEPGKILRRDAAQAGQEILVTGTLGDAAGALWQMNEGCDVDSRLLDRLNRPRARVAFGEALSGLASAAVDVSDGLLADLGHVLDASGCGARIEVDTLPASPALARLPREVTRSCQLGGGDDYELCFTVDAVQVDRVRQIARQLDVAVTRIGRIESSPGLRCVGADGRFVVPAKSGFDHFSRES